MEFEQLALAAVHALRPAPFGTVLSISFAETPLKIQNKNI